MKYSDSIYFQYLMLEYNRIKEKYRKSLEKFSTSGTMKTDGGAGSGNFNHAGRPGKVGGAAPTVSAEGENASCTGFRDKARLKDHNRRHGFALGTRSESEYQKKGIAFLKQACGGDVVGYATSGGKVVRFNRKTTEYASGYPGRQICTYMLAKCDEKTGKPNVKKANEYYEQKKERDLKDGIL